MNIDLSNRIDSVPERFTPAEAPGELAAAEHLARYWWAARLAAGRRALDAGCGTGYGANVLAKAGAAEVVGVDVAEAVIDAAAGAAAPNVSFEVADVRDLPFDDGSFDLIACFEVIEHLDERERMISELARVLNRRGVLVLSSPNRDAYVPGNPHHIYEYTPEELEEALAKSFEYVAVRRQHGWIGSAILDDADAASDDMMPLHDMQVAKALGAKPGSEPYTIVLAGSSPLPAPGPAMVLTGLAEVRKWLELWHEQQDVLTGQHRHFQQLDSQRTELESLREELRRSEAEIARIPELELAAARERELDARIEALEQYVEELEDTAERVYNSVSWRITTPLRRAKRIAKRN